MQIIIIIILRLFLLGLNFVLVVVVVVVIGGAVFFLVFWIFYQFFFLRSFIHSVIFTRLSANNIFLLRLFSYNNSIFVKFRFSLFFSPFLKKKYFSVLSILFISNSISVWFSCDHFFYSFLNFFSIIYFPSFFLTPWLLFFFFSFFSLLSFSF